jgi:hypothetical protein
VLIGSVAAQVRSRIEFCAHEIEPPAVACYSHYSEATSYNDTLIDKARDDPHQQRRVASMRV